MLSNSTVDHRAKHFKLLLARKLSLIEREHLHNLSTHQKLENSIRRASYQSSNNNRNKISASFDQIYSEQTGYGDYHSIRSNNNNNNNNNTSNQKHRFSFGTSSSTSLNQGFLDHSEEFFDNTASYPSLRRRRFCTKSQRLPPIIKANVSDQQKREKKNHYWSGSFQESIIFKGNVYEPFTVLNEEISKPDLSEISTIDRQVRSFLETLPTYKDVQHGFDSFAPAALYSNRAPIAIR